MSTSAQRPYWLDGGTESCTACTHMYVVQSECRCVACDRGCCLHCAVIEHGSLTVLCPECSAAAQTGAGED